jgi:hypothetical protein
MLLPGGYVIFTKGTCPKGTHNPGKRKRGFRFEAKSAQKQKLFRSDEHLIHSGVQRYWAKARRFFGISYPRTEVRGNWKKM